MDYYKGKDLDRQVQMLRGVAEHFKESQIIEIWYQIAVALEFCHSMNILHQDMKPMNNVPDLYVADFGIASHVHTMGTRLTAQRGKPGYEAPEIRGKGYQAAVSQKSDVYAFGCILHRLCTLGDPVILDNLKPYDISAEYSIDILSLVSSMLSSERDERPTATQVKEQLAALALKLFSSPSLSCRACNEEFISKNALYKHLKKTGHGRKDALLDRNVTEVKHPIEIVDGLTIRGVANAPTQYHFDHVCENDQDDVSDPSPCVVCMRRFKSKQEFFKHLHGGHHYRGPGYVRKRRAETGLDSDAQKPTSALKIGS